MDFSIINIEVKNSPSGRGHLIRFGLSWEVPGKDPFLDQMGYLLSPEGKVFPPSTYSQRGQRTNVIIHSEEFLEDLERLWRTHPELKEYSDLIAPDVSVIERMPLKDRVKISLKGLRDEV